MADQCAHKLLVRHVGGEIVYLTTSFRTEDKTGVLLVFEDQAQKRLTAAYAAGAWIAAELCEEVDDARESSDAVET